MTRLLPLAGLIMRWTAAAAPRDQGVWVRAMRAEFDAIRDGGQAVGWAAGCLAVALGWRLRVEAGYVIALILVSIGWPYIMAYGVPVLDQLPFGTWLFWAGLAGNLVSRPDLPVGNYCSLPERHRLLVRGSIR